jgi:hypothetical protein
VKAKTETEAIAALVGIGVYSVLGAMLASGCSLTFGADTRTALGMALVGFVAFFIVKASES